LPVATVMAIVTDVHHCGRLSHDGSVYW